MYANVNGTRLYFDVEGAGLVADGPGMRARPTVVLVHGGPGGDHSVYKPAHSVLSDLAQVVYYDHRGNGRSDLSSKEHWTLDQWADDLRGLCDYLGIEKPIVIGQSFGGFVAQAYAIRHPGHARKIALITTAAKVDFAEIYAAFERLGGADICKIAHDYWEAPTDELRSAYRDACVPYYSISDSGSTDWLTRVVWKNETALWFNGPKGEHGRFDFRAGLRQINCPVLVVGGAQDPIMPIPFSEEMASCVPQDLLTYRRLENCGHLVMQDQPDAYLKALHDFILLEP